MNLLNLAALIIKGRFFCVRKKNFLQRKIENSNRLRVSLPLSSIRRVAQVIKENSPSSYLSATANRDAPLFTAFRIDCWLGVDIGPSVEGVFSIYIKRLSRCTTHNPRCLSP